MSKELSNSINSTAVGYFANEVSKFMRTMPDIMSDSEARRLTTSLVIKASSSLEEAKIPWNKVDQPKFVNDAIRIVTMNLDAGNNEAYAIPYNNPKTGKVDLQCMPSAKGLKKIVELYSVKPIRDFREFVIKEGDIFKVSHTPIGDSWEYDEDVFGSGKTRGYVTIVTYEDDVCNVMTHSKADIEKRRQASKAPNSPAWKNWYDEMALAKATRRHCGKITTKMPSAIQDAFDAVDDAEAEQVTKDVTPPTIGIDMGHPAGDQIVQEPQEAQEPIPDNEPATESPVTVQAHESKSNPERLSLDTEAESAPVPDDAPGYNPNDTSWME